MKTLREMMDIVERSEKPFSKTRSYDDWLKGLNARYNDVTITYHPTRSLTKAAWANNGNGKVYVGWFDANGHSEILSKELEEASPEAIANVEQLASK